MRVVLISMPYGALERQALGLSLLKPQVTRRGFDCDVRYLTFPWADLIGFRTYQWIGYELPQTMFGGEWTFAEALWGPRPDSDRAYLSEICAKHWQLSPEAIARLMHTRSLVPHFLEYCLAAVDWSGYDVVGFTSTFEQNVASLALAQRIKQRYPHLIIVFGGANWEGEMGEEYLARLPFVDAACSGEAEHSFTGLLTWLRDGRDGPPNTPGVVVRYQDRIVATGPGAPIQNLDDLPVPDFSDYFRDLAGSGAGTEVLPTLLFESSRGCWWGAKSHCTFCGLNGEKMAFRKKSPRRALAELRELVTTWQPAIVEAVDNILDMGYFQEFLPGLAREQLGVPIFYEVKANLRRHHLRALQQAGVTRIQPGIESLSNHVLALMRKGTTALRNIQLLKWCQEYGITAEWNLLFGFPGETRDDYEDVRRLMRSVSHLRPPTACGPLRLDRFSPYHRAPGAFGLRNLRPLGSYRHLYPWPDEALMRTAYYFDFDYDPAVDPKGCANDAVREAEAWRQQPERGTLTAVRRSDGGLTLIDTRSTARRLSWEFRGLEQAVLEYCDEVHSLSSIMRHLASKPHLTGTRSISERGVGDFLDAAGAQGLLAHDHGSFVLTAIATPDLAREFEGGKEAGEALQAAS